MADIGEKLKSAREAKGLSIEDIEKATKIQSRYLTAIEKNEFDKLPGDFYVRAFIRQYAQVVGLDGKELLSDYHEDVPEADPDEYVENSIDNKSEEVRETTNNKKSLWKNYLPRIAIALGVIIVILVVYALYAHISSGGQHNEADNSGVTVSSQKTSSSSSKKTKPVAVSAVKIKKINDNEYRVLGLKKNRRLVVKAGSTQNTSAGVQINGDANSWQGTLIAKQKHTLTLPSNAERVVITLGNDNGSSIKIGGKKVPYVPNNSYRTITLLIGKAKKTTTHQTNDNNSQNGTTSDNNTNNSNTTTQNQTQSGSTTRHNTQTSHQQSSTTQSSPTRKSSQTQQSSTTQSSTPTTQNNNAGRNDNGGSGNENNGN
ncbi:helix-turn-helix domain-containing protein [Lactobacillus helveticus]|nr:helix-turn-helix domain-containing protein [Lactobacillus helveticus]MBW8037707.1 helix-turn-helix domain-containing protein [Lactobacillus helveticus]